MLTRVTDERHKNFINYNTRGITVCDRWNPKAGGSFENFLEDMGERPSGLTLDRIDINGAYTKSNCRWVDISTQNFNKDMKETNKSGRTGVYQKTGDDRWHAGIGVGGREVKLGIFESFEEACAARTSAEMEYYGFVKQ